MPKFVSPALVADKGGRRCGEPVLLGGGRLSGGTLTGLQFAFFGPSSSANCQGQIRKLLTNYLIYCLIYGLESGKHDGVPSADNGAGFEEVMVQRSFRCLVRCQRAATVLALVAALCSCAGGPSPDDPVGDKDFLRDNLSVAAVALAAGQPSVAHRLYLSLAERFDDAPEPLLGLGFVAARAGDFSAAKRRFLGAAALAGDAPGTRAEALVGAGRAALAEGAMDEARQHFQDARDAGLKLSPAAWAANGIGVVAALGADYEAAEASYGEALRLSSGHPRIAANLVRLLLVAGKEEEAARLHAQHDSSYWLEDDRSLSRLIEEARRERRRQNAAQLLRPGLAMRLSESGQDAPPIRQADPPRSSPLVLRLNGGKALTLARATPAAKSEATRMPLDPNWAEIEDTAPSRSLPTTLTLAIGQSQRVGLSSSAASVLVASPEVADVQLLSPNLLYIVGKSVGRTTVAVLAENGRARDWIVSVMLDLEPVLAILAEEPDLRGVRARRVARGIALSGEVASAALVERTVRLAAAVLPKDTIIENELGIEGAQQVNLEVQIAEVQRSLTENLGINWEAFRTAGDGLFGFRIGRLLPGTSSGDLGIAGFTPTSFDGQPSTEFFFGGGRGRTRIAGMIDALAQAGSANVLARPNLTAVSGEAASFFSGGEYPLPTGFDDGVIVFEYKKYGVLLDFVPTVIDTGRIVLKVRPEVSEPSLNQSVQVVGVNIPVINVRRAETTVEVGDGESIVIGGLFRNASNTREAGIPLLKDIPAMGPLFGNRSIRSDDLELIVIVTARLVHAGRPPDERGAHSPPRIGGYYY